MSRPDRRSTERDTDELIAMVFFALYFAALIGVAFWSAP